MRPPASRDQGAALAIYSTSLNILTKALAGVLCLTVSLALSYQNELAQETSDQPRHFAQLQRNTFALARGVKP
tara:strand:- start:1592 stop:1810 length:219 start_codon:yes stop_codon:yes gene_type:complete